MLSPRFAFVSYARIALVLSLVGFTACKSGVQTSRDTLSNPKGIGSGLETITHTDDATQTRMAEVQYSRDSLAVGQTITVASTYHTDPAEVAEDFGIGSASSISPTDVAVAVTSNVDQNLDNPMTIALDLPSGGASLAGLIWDNRIFFVVYTVKDSSTGKWTRGIMADSELTVKNSQVLFQSKYWGRYEIFESVKEVVHTRSEVAVDQQDFTKPPVAMKTISPLVARIGATVTIKGRYFTKASRLFVGGKEVKASLTERGVLSFVVPAMDEGMTSIVVKEQQSEATAEFMIKPLSAQEPFIDAKPASVCAGISYIDREGKVQSGAKDCGPLACSSEGQSGCLTTSDFPAAAKADVPYAKMTDVLTVLGKQGLIDLPDAATPCTRAGQVGCLISSGYVSLQKGQVTAAMLRKGVIIPEELTNTSAHIFGTYPSAINPLAPASGSWAPLRSHQFSAALTASPAKPYKFFDRTGKAHSFTPEGTLVADAIVAGVEIHGVIGSASAPTAPLCQDPTEQNCYIKAPRVAVARADLVPANIRKGAAIGAVPGNYPSSTALLDAPPSGAPQLTSSNFNSAIGASAAFVFYDSNGQQLFTRVDPNLKAENLKKGLSLFGHTGTVEGFDPYIYRPEHIREGVQFGSITGTLRVGCRNQATQATFNYTGEYGTGDLDPFDTIHDGLSPKENPWPGKSEYVCDQNVWEDLTVNGCGAPENKCILRNKHTGNLWGAFTANERGFTSAANYCSGFVKNGRKDWRLPTVHELMVAYAYGFNHVVGGNPRFFQQNMLWSSSNAHGSGTDVNSSGIPVRTFSPKLGMTSSADFDNGSSYVLCIMPDPSY